MGRIKEKKRLAIVWCRVWLHGRGDSHWVQYSAIFLKDQFQIDN